MVKKNTNKIKTSPTPPRKLTVTPSQKLTVKKESLSHLIENVLTSNVSCRSNDVLLYATILNRYFGVEIADDRLMLDVNVAKNGGYPPLGSVSRIRRAFQAKGWFHPTTRREQFVRAILVRKGSISKVALKRFSKLK